MCKQTKVREKRDLGESVGGIRRIVPFHMVPWAKRTRYLQSTAARLTIVAALQLINTETRRIKAVFVRPGQTTVLLSSSPPSLTILLQSSSSLPSPQESVRNYFPFQTVVIPISSSPPSLDKFRVVMRILLRSNRLLFSDISMSKPNKCVDVLFQCESIRRSKTNQFFQQELSHVLYFSLIL